MSKRKLSDQNYEQLFKKLKSIEGELRRHKSKKKPVKRRRVRVLSSASESSVDDSTLLSQKYDNEVSVHPPNDTPNTGDTADMGGIAYAAESVDAADTEQNVLDVEVMEILGVDPTTTKKYGIDIQKDLAIRLEHSAIEGLSKDNRKELVDTYLVPINCKLIGAPILNPELKAALSESVIKRDKAIEAKQKVTAAAIASLGQAISITISSKESKDTTLLRLLMDTGRILCDCQHSDTLTRRNYVISSIKKDMKESLLSSKTDNYLFGDKLPDTLRAAKAISKSGAELKINTAPKPGPSKFTTSASSSKNWKTNPPLRKTAPAAAKDTATRSQRASSSKTSQSQQRHSRR